MKVFDVYIGLIKQVNPQFQFDHNHRDLFDLREAALKCDLNNFRLMRVAAELTPLKCYYSAIEECLANDLSPQAEKIKEELLFWYKNSENLDVQKLKFFIESKINEHFSSWSWFALSSSVSPLVANLQNILDEIPVGAYFKEEAHILDVIQALLKEHSETEPAWADNIKTIQTALERNLSEKQSWVNIKKALREDCEYLLTPGRLSFYSTPMLKEKLKEALEGIPSERYLCACAYPDNLIQYSHLINQALKLYEAYPPVNDSIEVKEAKDLYFKRKSSLKAPTNELKALQLNANSSHRDEPNSNVSSRRRLSCQ